MEGRPVLVILMIIGACLFLSLPRVDSSNRDRMMVKHKSFMGGASLSVALRNHRVMISGSQDTMHLSTRGISGVPPPPVGDWNITEVTVVENMTLIINGSILIQSGVALILKNSTIYMNLSYDGEHYIRVYSDANLTLIGSTITAYNKSNNYYITVDDNGHLYAYNSEISFAGYWFQRPGLYIGGRSELINTTIHHNYIGISLRCFYNKIINCTIRDCSLRGIQIGFLSNDNNITNNILINNTWYGIYMDTSQRNRIANNTIIGSYIGMEIEGSSNNWIINNTFINCSLELWDSYNNVIEDNYVNGKPLLYIEDSSNVVLDEVDVGAIVLVNVWDTIIKHVDISRASIGIELWDCRSTTIVGCSLNDNNYVGIEIASSENITIMNCSVTGWSEYGIYLTYSESINIVSNDVSSKTGIENYNSNNSVIVGNRIRDCSHGVHVWSGYDNKVIYNKITGCSWGGVEATSAVGLLVRGNLLVNNYYGIYIEDNSKNITVTRNAISDGDYGIYIYNSDNITVYLNNFVNNTKQAFDNKANSFDNGTYGNYWSDYTGTDSNSDGIGDTPYSIDADSIDSYPLMNLVDTYPPAIHEVWHTPIEPTENDTVTVYANVTDNVSVVILSYYNGSSWTNITMNYNKTSGCHEAQIHSLPQGTNVLYLIYASDIHGNWNISRVYEYTVLDTTPPTILSVSRLPERPSPEDYVLIIAEVTDNVGISTVILSYCNDTLWINVSMAYNEEYGYYEGTIPPHPIETTIRYKVYANDTFGNWAVSQEYSYTVVETTPPTIISVERNISIPTDTDYVKVMANITDGSGVSIVILSYHNGTIWVNVTMEYNETSGYYEAIIPLLLAGTNVSYKVYACDVYNNWVVSDEYSYLVIELRPPVIVEVIQKPEIPSYEDVVWIFVNATDDTAISRIILSYYINGSWTNMTMLYDETSGYYKGIILSQPLGTIVIYKIYAYDIFDNWIVSEEYNYTVIETSPPMILEIIQIPEMPTSMDTVRILVGVVDDTSVSTVILSYNANGSWVNTTMEYNQSTGYYEATIPGFPAGTTIKFKIYACDVFENWIISGECSYVVIELNPPVFLEIKHHPKEPLETDTVTVIVKVSDDSKIEIVILSYYDGSSWTNKTMTYDTDKGVYEATIPPMKAGLTVYYKVYACDIFGNWAVSKTYSYQVRAWLPAGYLSILLVAVVVVALTVSTIFILKRKKRKD